MRLSRRHSYLICLLIAHGGVNLRAEFPPDTFPDESKQAVPAKDGAYEEDESRAAEEEYLAPRKRRTQPAIPSPNSTPAGPRRRVPRESRPREYALEDEEKTTAFERRLTLSLFGGMNTFTSSSALAQPYISRAYIDTHLSLGVMADFQFMKYFGVDFDGFLGNSPAQPVVLTSGGPTQTLQISELGTLLSARLEYPISAGKWAIRPRVFVGYGIINNTQSSTTTTGAGSFSIQVTGIYAGGGIEAEWGTIVRLFADYATSVNTSATTSLGGVSGSGSNPATPSGFQRLRLGLSGRFFDYFWLGGMFVVRGIGTGSPADPSANKLIGEIDTMNNFLVTFGVAL
jgi:hypothetical protein